MARIKVKIIRIGNSKGIRLPKSIIEQYQLKDEATMETRKDGIIIRPSDNPRSGWDAAFQKMSRAGDDTLMDADTSAATEWDEKEWEW